MTRQLLLVLLAAGALTPACVIRRERLDRDPEGGIDAFVVGEDLGTVEPEVRAMLAERRIAGTRVLWFEDEPPSTWPADTLATVTTHDLPTVTQVFVRDEPDDEVRNRLLAVAPDATDPASAIVAANAALLAASSRLRLVSTDDLAGAIDQPNVPGRNDHPNWRIRLPKPVSELL